MNRAQAILIAEDADYLDRVEAAIVAQLTQMERADIIAASLRNRGALIQVDSLDDAFTLSNTIGPEHLELALEGAECYLERILVAGAIFVGSNTCESLGDYCAGPNHVLPTSSTARFSSPLGFTTFRKEVQSLSAQRAGPPRLVRWHQHSLAVNPSTAHARSAELRCKK